MLKLTIPRIPPSPNGPGGYLRLHWTKRRKDKEAWKWEVMRATAKVRGIGDMFKPAPSRRVKVTIHQVRARLLDRDNLWASVKHICDSIVVCGLARDDSEKWMDLSVSQETGKDHRTEITIE